MLATCSYDIFRSTLKRLAFYFENTKRWNFTIFVIFPFFMQGRGNIMKYYYFPTTRPIELLFLTSLVSNDLILRQNCQFQRTIAWLRQKSLKMKTKRRISITLELATIILCLSQLLFTRDLFLFFSFILSLSLSSHC